MENPEAANDEGQEWQKGGFGTSIGTESDRRRSEGVSKEIEKLLEEKKKILEKLSPSDREMLEKIDLELDALE